MHSIAGMGADPTPAPKDWACRDRGRPAPYMHESMYADRFAKANKISAILSDFLGGPVKGRRCADVGCAIGAVAIRLAESGNEVVGIDLNRAALLEAVAVRPRELLAFIQSDAAAIPISSESLDIVIAAQVYEHTPDPESMAQEVYRILRPGGVCFFSGPNKYTLLEEHYWLPFLSWLPRQWATAYIKLFRRGGQYDIHSLSWRDLRGLWRRFTVVDYTWRLVKEPERFGGYGVGWGSKMASRVPSFLIRRLACLAPNFNWILVKG